MKNSIRLMVWLCLSGWCASMNGQPASDFSSETAPAWNNGIHNAAHEIVAVGRDVILRSNEVGRTLVCVGGTAEIDGTLRQDAVIVFGKSTIRGEVHGKVVSVFSDTELESSAVAHRGLVLVGGRTRVDPAAHVGGERFELMLSDSVPQLRWVGDWLSSSVLRCRLLPPHWSGVWVAAGILGAAYLLIALMLPRPLQACAAGLVRRPVVTFLVGTLGWIALVPLLFILIVSVAGVLVVPFVLVAVVMALFLGKAAIFQVAGEQIAAVLHLSFLQNSILAVAVGAILFFGMYMVPVVAFVAWGMATIWALGAVLVSMFRSVERKPAPALVVPASVVAAGVPTSAAAAVPLAGAYPPAEPVRPAAPPLVAGSAELVTLPPAGFWIRFIGAVLDWVLLGIGTWLLSSLIPWFHASPPFFLLLLIVYHVVMWTWKSTTFGGIVLGLKLVRLDGRPVDISVALVRALSALFSAAALFLGFFWAGWDWQKQSWHDKIAGTVLVKMNRNMALV